jgi:hypothetical protein
MYFFLFWKECTVAKLWVRRNNENSDVPVNDKERYIALRDNAIGLSSFPYLREVPILQFIFA